METKDALLHAINEEFVEAVEVLLDHEETIHKPGELHVSLMIFSPSLQVNHFQKVSFVHNFIEQFDRSFYTTVLLFVKICLMLL
jgi:hypothetical protein